MSNTQYFFVTGLPRSRTGWLANLLTVTSSAPGEQGYRPYASFCWHDVLGGCSKVEDLDQYKYGVRADFVGISDPALALVWWDVAAAFPEAKWVVVRRNPFEAARSYAAFLEKHGWGLPWDQVRVAIERWGRELIALEGSDRVHVLAYDELEHDEDDEYGALIECWAWLFQDKIPWSKERFEMLRRLNVQTMPAKAPFDLAGAGWRAWAEQAMAKG